MTKGNTMQGLHYTEDHSWLREEGDGFITIGITDHAQEQLGDVVFVQLPETGHHFSIGDEVVVIESVKAAGDIRMPVDGRIEVVNHALVDEPSLVNTLPEAERWFLKIKADQPALPEKLMDAQSYLAHVG
jgi:glycine cleavage system H protein